MRSFFEFMYLFLRWVLRQFIDMLCVVKLKSRILFNEITKHAKVRQLSLRIQNRLLYDLDMVDLIFLTPIVLSILYIWVLNR